MSGYFSLRGSVLDASLNPLSGEFEIDPPPGADAIEPVAVAIGESWIVTWTNRKRYFEEGGFHERADIGHALVTASGTVANTYQPEFTSDFMRRRPVTMRLGDRALIAYQRESVTFSPRRESAIAAFTVDGDGTRASLNEAILAQGATSRPSLRPAGIALTLIYSRPAQELGFGAAPQIFEREVMIAGSRRRLVAR